MEELQWGFPIATTQSLNKRISINEKKKWRRLKTRASEAKGPFPGGKRVGSWGKIKKKRKKKVDPPSAVGGLKGI
jgi:hypothetical protein